jgi:protein-disulfide isomerase
LKETKDLILIFSLSLNFGFLIAGGWYYLIRMSSPVASAAPATAAAEPAPLPSAVATAAPVALTTEGHPSRGPANAPVTIVEFSDFQCPFCGRETPVLKQIEDAYPGKIRRVFRQFPIASIHSKAKKAAEASLCANEQGKFWELHDTLFEQPSALELTDIYRKADGLKLNKDSFRNCLESSKYAAAVEHDLQEGIQAGVTGTPAVFINGRMVNGARPYADMASLIGSELAKPQKP